MMVIFKDEVEHGLCTMKVVIFFCSCLILLLKRHFKIVGNAQTKIYVLVLQMYRGDVVPKDVNAAVATIKTKR